MEVVISNERLAVDVHLKVIVRLGDVWLLGAHRLVCGDCTDAAAVSAVLAGIPNR
jgi:hypothetical protein